jgi:hypothetical protein
MRMVAVTAALLACLGSPRVARGADLELALEAELGAGVDTNPERVLGASESADGFAVALVRGKLRLEGERAGLSAQLSEAGRLYFGAGSATAGASRLEAQGQLRLSERVSAGASLLASDLTERGHRLDHDVLDGSAFLSWASGPWGASATAGWNLFAPRDAPLRAFLSSGPHAGVRGSWRFLPAETLHAGYDFAAPAYPRWREAVGTERDDRTHTLSAEWVHRGSFLAGLGYAYSWNRSSAAGGDFDRHRVTGRLATYLPYDFTLALRGSLQWSRYPEPLFLAEQILLAEGQQNLDSLEARLTHPLRGALEVALSLALYRAEAVVGPGDAPSFTRGVASLALTWRGEWQR